MLSALGVALCLLGPVDGHRIFLHRAASMAAPENSIPALVEAVRQHADGVEIDVRKTLDGHFVLYHDDWILRPYGPGTLVEDLTLAEARAIDIGERWGPRWKGLRMPLLRDVIDFCRRANLRMFFDIKTPGTGPEVERMANEAGASHLIDRVEGSLRNDSAKFPTIQGWNYTDGGEQDLAKIRSLMERQTRPVFVMTNDARSFAIALGRKIPRQAPRFLDTYREVLNDLPFSLKSRNVTEVRRALRRQMLKPDLRDSGTVFELARRHPNPRVRLDAVFALGKFPSPQHADWLKSLALAEPEGTRNDPRGEFYGTFLTAAAAGALVGIGSTQAHEALHELAQSESGFDRVAVAVAYAAWGKVSDLPRLERLIAETPTNRAMVSSLAIGFGGRFGRAAIPLFVMCLSRDGYTAKLAVFALAGLGSAARIHVVKATNSANPKVAHEAKNALYWIDWDLRAYRTSIAKSSLK